MAGRIPKNVTSNKKLDNTISNPRARTRGSEYRAIVYISTAVFLFLCLLSYDSKDPSFNAVTDNSQAANLCGVIGAHISDLLIQAIGFASFLVPLGLALLSLRVFLTPTRARPWSDTAAMIVMIAGSCLLLERFAVVPLLGFAPERPGGAVGVLLHNSLLQLAGPGGELLMSLTLVLLCLVHIFRVPLSLLGQTAISGAGLVKRIFTAVLRRLRTDGVACAAVQEDRLDLQGGSLASKQLDCELEALRQTASVHKEFEREEPSYTDRAWGNWDRLSVLPNEDGKTRDSRKRYSESADLEYRPNPLGNGAITVGQMKAAIKEYLREQSVQRRKLPQRVASLSPHRTARHKARPIQVAKRADENVAHTAKFRKGPASNDDYKFPPTDLLDAPQRANRSVDQQVLERNAVILEKKLADLGIRGQVVAIHPGPVITMYELSLGARIPLRKVLSTADDLAMALKSGSTRVVAPIPGKDTVGIEVPNQNRELVYFREIVESPLFTESDAPLKMALGKRIDGEPFATSLTKMPHLLIAGATGTGKSVGLNCLICSWLMCCHPDDLKLLMVDPKRLELSYYQDIPHLIHPVVTDPEKVPAVLGWAIKEMERRYELLSETGAKNIESYNRRIRSGKVKANPDESAPEKLPYIVIIVDELAELMMVAAKDIEVSICRLAQMARAAGIHLILATQRPSVDVITGIIKANFPARISFQVSARADSRTILDTVGAEHLLGRGDMLFMPPATAKLSRLHGAYISEEDIRRVVDFIKGQRQPVYLQEISKHVESQSSKPSGSDLIEDEKYDEAVELVTRLGHASISLIQRHMRIGYNRAARIIEAMEQEGLIGPSDGTSRPREVRGRSLEHIAG